MLLSTLQMRRLRTQRLSFLTEVTGPGLSDIRVHAFNHSAIRALRTVLDLAKLELFVRDGCGTWPSGVSESESAGSG